METPIFAEKVTPAFPCNLDLTRVKHYKVLILLCLTAASSSAFQTFPDKTFKSSTEPYENKNHVVVLQTVQQIVVLHLFVVWSQLPETPHQEGENGAEK